MHRDQVELDAIQLMDELSAAGLNDVCSIARTGTALNIVFNEKASPSQRAQAQTLKNGFTRKKEVQLGVDQIIKLKNSAAWNQLTQPQKVACQKVLDDEGVRILGELNA